MGREVEREVGGKKEGEWEGENERRVGRGKRERGGKEERNGERKRKKKRGERNRKRGGKEREGVSKG